MKTKQKAIRRKLHDLDLSPSSCCEPSISTDVCLSTGTMQSSCETYKRNRSVFEEGSITASESNVTKKICKRRCNISCNHSVDNKVIGSSLVTQVSEKDMVPLPNRKDLEHTFNAPSLHEQRSSFTSKDFQYIHKQDPTTASNTQVTASIPSASNENLNTPDDTKNTKRGTKRSRRLTKDTALKRQRRITCNSSYAARDNTLIQDDRILNAPRNSKRIRFTQVTPPNFTMREYYTTANARQQRHTRQGPPNTYVSIGNCNQICKHCQALFWLDERAKRSSSRNPECYRCCNNGKHFNKNGKRLKREIVEKIKEILDTHNELVRLFRTARDKMQESNIPDFKLKLFGVVGSKQHDLPTGDSIGAIVFEGGPDVSTEYDVVIEKRDGQPQQIDKLNPHYMSLHFPLLFIHGELGYHLGLKLLDKAGETSDKEKQMSMKMYYAYQLYDRHQQYSLLLRAGRLFQEYVVTAYCSIEQQRLDYIRNNQKDIRNEYMAGLYDALSRGDVDAYMQDYPELTTADRPDVVDRVFERKIHDLVTFLRQSRPFGDVEAGTSDTMALSEARGKEIITQPDNTKLVDLKATDLDKTIYIKVYRKWTVTNKASLPTMHSCILLDQQVNVTEASTTKAEKKSTTARRPLFQDTQAEGKTPATKKTKKQD
ncbi:hypothetical protein CTI12_AA198250 [Artemisia annua]|uniref:Helitron helicase-like domain-containing protein n=1 Tax=Artemisia annua TaxID=35608 RepID=A0A2U1P3B9_ARTAN|nr:hypothetical protein CTI12_AA198250 [Artemisia annua]